MRYCSFPATARRQVYGFTLIEVMIVVAIIGILAAIALPAFSSMRETWRLKGSAEAVQSDLRLAKSESIKRSGNVSVTFRTSDTIWCYGFSQDTPCDCNTPNSCLLDGVEYRFNHLAYPGIALASNVSGNRFSFQYRRGTVTAGNVQLTAPNGRALRVVVSGLGRIRLCSPAGAGRIAGYPDCS